MSQLSLLELDDKYCFLFETLGSDDEYKAIRGSSPIQTFKSLEDLETFIEKNLDKYRGSDAGFAGYVTYEGEMEFAFYEKITVTNKAKALFYKEKHTKLRIKSPEAKKFTDAVKKCQEYIVEGDIYQANITRKFLIEKTSDESYDPEELPYLGEEIYTRLRKANPAPFSGYMNFDDYQIISSSPESFLKFEREGEEFKISSSPIKGTADLENKEFLEDSHKDKAEHIMIVDLERNDLGRISKTGSVKVDEMMKIYQFKNLYHYISTISGNLRDDLHKNGLKIKTIFDACFPGGSITGAPKIRAMEIIKELEDIKRGPYTGSMGYFKIDPEKGEGEFNILIRSIVIDKNAREISFHAGGGITAYSDPQAELEETELKAEKLVDALNQYQVKELEDIDSLVEAIKIENNEAQNLKAHFERLSKSAQELNFVPTGSDPVDKKRDKVKSINDRFMRFQELIKCKIEESLCENNKIYKLRYILNKKGEEKIEIHEYPQDRLKKESLKVKILEPEEFHINSKSKIHRHKYLPRPDLSRFFAKEPVDELIWLNEKGEICEGSYTNVFFRKANSWYTPALDCGLLPGTARAKLIKELNVKEGHYSKEELEKADEIRLSNALINKKGSLLRVEAKSVTP